MLFALIVSKIFFGWTMLQCVMCSLFGAIMELLFEIVFSPIGYRISKKLEQDKIGEQYLNYIEGKDESSN